MDSDWAFRAASVGGTGVWEPVELEDDLLEVEVMEEAFGLGTEARRVEEGFEGTVLAEAWEKSFHFRQPSKSMRACMQPHSITFRSSQTKLTGCSTQRLERR